MMRKTAILLLIFLFSLPANAFAGYGPVEVKLGREYPELTIARANRPNTMNILVKYDQELERGFVRIWLPIDESECGLGKMCDETPKITGDIESPRFVPNAKYFEKYPKSPEKEYTKLYKITSRKDNTIETYQPEPCKDGKCRLIPDPSGLGSWMMGTVMPKLYIDPAKREEQLKKIGHCFDYFGWSQG